ncbi:photosystem I reaction center subunit PsaK [uncultured Nostoc sp.]|uniref:photosystem I reaction center subunit PsaK n=1 Tax=uncultured Nostoc sp. TaxID=340711 RepID=UPI0035C95C65
MTSSILLAAAAASVPATPAWNPTVGIIISISSLVIVLLSTRIEKPLVGPKFPILPISIPTFVAAMAFGHIIGVGIVLGLTYIGRL